MKDVRKIALIYRRRKKKRHELNHSMRQEIKELNRKLDEILEILRKLGLLGKHKMG